MKVTPIIRKNAGSDYHRIANPLKYMGIATDVEKISSEQLGKSDIIIFNRHPVFSMSTLLELKKQYGFKIICDIDDFPELSPWNPAYKDWEAGNHGKRTIEALLKSDMVFASTEALASAMKGFNSNIEVIPNALPFDNEQFSKNKIDSEDFEIVYAASISHLWDVILQKNLFYKIAREELRKKIKFSLAGYNESNKRTKEIWTRMENIFSAGGRLNYQRKPHLPLNEYMNHYDGASAAIAPLEKTIFNGFKSNLKILEAGCKELPIICSNVSPYSDEPTDLIILTENTKDWYNKIKYLSENRECAKDLGKRLGEYVREKYDLIEINKKRQQIFEYLCSN